MGTVLLSELSVFKLEASLTSESKLIRNTHISEDEHSEGSFNKDDEISSAVDSLFQWKPTMQINYDILVWTNL